MLEQILNLLKIAGALLAFTAIWLLTIAAVFRDLQRRNLHGIEQFLWLAATTLLPLAGFVIYWVARMLTRLLLPDERRVEDPRLRMTMARPIAPPASVGRVQSPPQRLSTLLAQSEPLQRREQPTNTLPANSWEVPLVAGSQTGFTLVALEGPYLGSKFPLPHFPARIGRGSSAAVALNGDQGISRQHAELYADGSGRVRIRDLNSTHGTFVNGQRVVDSPLNLGDRVKVGVSAFLFTNL